MDVQHAEEIMTKVMILNTYCIHSLWLIFSFVIEVPFSLSILGPINHQPEETYDALVKEREKESLAMFYFNHINSSITSQDVYSFLSKYSKEKISRFNVKTNYADIIIKLCFFVMFMQFCGHVHFRVEQEGYKCSWNIDILGPTTRATSITLYAKWNLSIYTFHCIVFLNSLILSSIFRMTKSNLLRRLAELELTVRDGQ